MARSKQSSGSRRLAIIVAALLAITVVPFIGSAPAAADAGDRVVVRGAGWGHGIGLSQYGALGQALEGRTAAEIVEYYYTGSTVDSLENLLPSGHFMLDDTSPVWISLETNATTFRFEAIDGDVTVCHIGLSGCGLTAQPGEDWEFVTLGDGTCRFYVDGNEATMNAGPCKGTIRGLSPAGAKVELPDQLSSRDTYARGLIQLRTPDSGVSVHASLEIGIERYLYGLAEVPASWDAEALKAQAIAARSYASYKTQLYGPEDDLSESRKTQCWCHMFSTVADQNFIGWLNEDEPDEAPWVAAVTATIGDVASHPAASQNNVVAGFYSSSTGGATQNNEDVWGGSAVSYLRSVPDPWSIDPGVGNPFASWTFTFTEAELATRFGLDAVSGLDIVSRFDSGAPSEVRITGRDDGKRVALLKTGAEFRSALELRGRHVSSIDHGSVDFLTGDFDGSGTGDISALLGATGSWFEFSDDGRVRAWANHGSNDTVSSPVAGDFDGDGKDDIAIRRSNNGAWIVGLSNGAGFKTQFWAGGSGDASGWRDGVVGDFDGNGFDDIAEYQASTGLWAVLLSDGTTFTRSTFYDFSVQNPQWGPFRVGDFDGDGNDDILHHDLVTQNLHVLFSDGATFTPKLWGSLPADSTWHVRVGAFNGDARTDVAGFDTATGTWWVVIAANNRTGAPAADWWDFQSNGFVSQSVGDFNGDGLDDIAGLAPNGQWRMLTAKPSGGFKWAKWGTTPRGHAVTATLVFDADNDGDDDVVTYNPDTKFLHMHTSDGTSFTVTWWGSLLR